MGATGSGKSTFINIASGAQLGIGAGLKSCTSDVQTAQAFELDRRRVMLIDTPEFDDTSKSDTDILELIGLFLQTTRWYPGHGTSLNRFIRYEKGMKLAGVIYMHRIMDVPVGGISKRNFSMFRELSGDSTLKKVAIVTTSWSKVTPQLGGAREGELRIKDVFFKPVFVKGARMLRHSNTVESAHDILRKLVCNHPMALHIQSELVDHHLDIAETRRQGRSCRRNLKSCRRNQKMQTDSQRLAEEFEAEKVETERRILEVQAKMRKEAEQQEEAHKARIDVLKREMQGVTAQSVEEKEKIQAELHELQTQRDDALEAQCPN